MASSRTITYPSGTIVRRKITGDNEVWELEGKSLCTSVFKIDLTQCEGIKFDDKSGERIKTITVPPLTTKDMFGIKKKAPFTFKPVFHLDEKPLPLKEQKKHTQKEREEIEAKVSKMEEAFKTLPFEVMPEKDLRKQVKKLGIGHFVDPHFPPRDTSIHCYTEPYPYTQIVHWRRPHEFMKDPKIFENDIDPNDIKQGFLPNCWFLSALSCLAERPGLVRRLILTKEYNKEGIYRIKLCKNGEWHVITVDDYFPCYFNGGPMFSRANGDELWVMLLEKAYAKMHCCYYSLRYGFTHHGMLDLTGCPTWNMTFPADKSDYDLIEDKALKIWDKIRQADESGYLISGETPGFDAATEGGGLDAPSGLVPGHAYSLIRVHEGLGQKLLNIRNPWGKYEWDGDWSDSSDLWTDEMKEEFEPILNADDGSFWMCLEDFITRFDSVNICGVRNWEEVRLKGKFMRVTEKEGEMNEWVISKFYYSFEIKEDETEIHIGIHQEDDRILGANRRRFLDASYVLFKIDEDTDEMEFVKAPEFQLEREVQGKFILDEGRYILVPLTTGACLRRPSNAKKEVINAKIEYENITMPHPFFLTTINDIFRKIDLALNGLLSAEELNQFGRIIGEKKFMEITPKSFTSKEFENISCNKYGLTNLGFKQFLFRNFEQDRIDKMMRKLGYDEGLYSIKSRVFVVSFQADSPVEVKINETIVGDLHTRAWDLYMNDQLMNMSSSKNLVQTSDYIFFRVDHDKCYGCSYGLANHSNKYLRIELDMTKSNGCYYNPKDGSSAVIVPPGGLKYVGSSLSDPDAEDFVFKRTFVVEETDPPEGMESEGSEEKGSEEDDDEEESD